MDDQKYDDPRAYETKGVFTQTADAEALIRCAAKLRDDGKMASVHKTAEDIREMYIIDGTEIHRIIAHFEPVKKAAAVRVENLFIVGPEVQDSADVIVSRPDMFYHRRSAVPVGDYTEEQVEKKMIFIFEAYIEAMKEGAKKRERTPSQPGSQSLDDRIEDPLDLMNIEVDTSEIDAATLEEARAAESSKAPEDQSPEDAAISYLEGNNKK